MPLDDGNPAELEPFAIAKARRCNSNPGLKAPHFYQGRTLVHFSAQRKRFWWDRRGMLGVFTR